MDTSARKETLERRKIRKKMSKAQMQLAIIKKKQCDAKALIIVEQLLEPKIDPDWLLDNLRYINKSHMEDVIEERAIIKLCGYVLCNNLLTTIIGQQYHISTKKNKVYDVTRRKNFCSSRCYGACNYLLEQMLTSPLWLRDKEEIPEFKVLPAKDELEKSSPGDEILVRDVNTLPNSTNEDQCIKNDIVCKNYKNVSPTINFEDNICDEHETSERTGKSMKIHDSTEDIDTFKEQCSKDSHEEASDTNEKLKESIMDNISEIFPSSREDTVEGQVLNKDCKVLNNDADSLNEDIEENIKSKEQNDLDAALRVEDEKIGTKLIISNNIVNNIEKAKPKAYRERYSSKEIQSNEFYNLAVHIERSVKEWITEDTISLLSGEEDIKRRLLENIVRHDRYLQICKKLNKLQLEDERDDSMDLNTSTLKPLPHLSVLQEQGKKMELKVKAFYQGSMIVEDPEKTSENNEQDNNFTPVLPLTDAHAPNTLRRRIFLDKLNRILPDLLRALASNKLQQYINNSEKGALVKALVNTFALSAANIIFKTAEWTLVGLIIIKMLSMVDPELKLLLSTKQATMYISMILMSYKLNSNYLDTLMIELINNTEIANTGNATNFDVA